MEVTLGPFIKINGLYTIGCKVSVFSDDLDFKYQIRVIASSEEKPNEFAIEVYYKGRGHLDIQLTNNQYYDFFSNKVVREFGVYTSIYKYRLINEVSNCIFEYNSK